MTKPKKVLVLGSGALKIGEAGEFDYSGSQAIKALKEEGIEIILVNPNIATVQTSEGMADRLYFLPVTPSFVERIIKKERPDGIIVSFGGQTALNCGVELHKSGVLRRHHVKVLGTPIQSVIDTEDRDLFVKRLNQADLNVPESVAVCSVKDALEAAKKIKYPVMVRVAYELGGKGSGVAYNNGQLKDIASKAFSHTRQILVEEYLGGWKEVEYEVVRDCCDNCITVCNMENLDPLGIHTGESIVVAPSQTLTNSEYHKLREISIRAIRHLGIIGECNIQFALDPGSEDYRIIEVNARLSRSSALASKATGYPLAFIAAKLALGYSLLDLQNSITKKTMACFEPALDYIVVKIPRWDMNKFKMVSRKLGPGMKSVGEVMAIGRKFEEVLQKAIRMLQVGMYGLVCNGVVSGNLDEEMKNPTDKRIFSVTEAMKKGYSADRIHSLTGIDQWFLYKMQNIVDMELKLKSAKNLGRELLRDAKKLGFSDKQIGMIVGLPEERVRHKRKEMGITPFVKQIDTLAAEYPAVTNYLYVTYNGSRDDVPFGQENAILVLGSGPYSIGSSVEFDWCCVNSAFTLRKLGYKTLMINYNPETVSTDYDVCDRLYFDELSAETVLDIYEKENPAGIVISMGGQIPNNIALKLARANAKILGTSVKHIDNAENRYKFSGLLDNLGIEQPEWKELKNIKSAKAFAKRVGYPVLVRPSYVLSGAAMGVALDDRELAVFLKGASDVSSEHPVVITKFITNAKEIELDAVAKDGSIVIAAISEHIENAGVHSGDATMILPPQKIYLETIKRIEKVSRDIAKALDITGPFNIQFIAKDNKIKVIECNLRASRSFPFVSKISKKNFIEMATKSIMGIDPGKYGTQIGMDYVGVKAPQFSYSRLKGADPISDVEMTSTGEVACLGNDIHEAFLDSLVSAGFRIPKKNILLSIGGDANKYKFLDSVKKLAGMRYNLLATEHTSMFLQENRIKNTMIYKVHNQHKKMNLINLISSGKIDLVINIPNPESRKGVRDGYYIRRATVDYSVPLITNLQVAEELVEALSKKKHLNVPDVKAWDEYT